MTDVAGLAKRIEPEVKSLGYDLVRVAMIGGTSDPTLQVMAERPDTRQLDLTDCEAISRRLSDWLDTNDPIEGSYRLEVSSPGIDRPLTRLKDYADWAGHDARISVAEPREGRKQFSGTIEGSYRLEVSSPGIDRPLTRAADYSDWAGHEARITLAEPRDGRKQFSGIVEGIDGGTVKLTDKTGQAHALPLSAIASAKLVLTDKLIQATAPLSTEGADTFQMQEE